MPSTSEVGHAKNVALFRDIVTHCEGLGAEYNPGNGSISLSALQAALAAAQAAIHGLDTVKNAYDNATDLREVAFVGLPAFGTRVTNALVASGALPQTVANARTYLTKLRGGSRRARPATDPVPVPDTDITPEADTPTGSQPTALPPLESSGNVARPRTISVSQRSYDQQVSHFARLLEVVSAEPRYTPNEPELTVAGLQTHLAALDSANYAVQQNNVAYENAIILRDTLLYAPDTGLIPLAAAVKSYVRSLYGSTSPNYKNLATIPIRKLA